MRTSLRRALTGTTVTVAALLGLGATAAAADTYTVQRGDTLSSIARAHDGVTSWQQLHAANRDTVRNPNVIRIGQVLNLPDGATATATSAVPARSTSTSTPATATSTSVDTGVWDRLAQCESSGNWSINTGNGYYGGLQFSLRSWRWVGGQGMPHQASKAEQINRAEILLERQGWARGWPSCSRQLGLR